MSKPEYEPALEAAVWLAIREFVLAAVADAVDSTPYNTRELSAAASRLTAWTWQSAGLPLERRIVFDRDLIARFIAVGCRTSKPAVRGNVRSQLLRMSEVLLDPRLVQRRLNPLPPSDPAAPYDPKELVALRSWASTQSTLARRTNAEVLLALGAGAGLSAIEIGELRVEDIEIDSDGVVVHTHGARPRAVPVLRDWEDALVERQRALAPNKFAFRENHAAYYPNLITNFVDRSRVVGVRPQSQRLRSTWILRHLEAATPVDLLMQAAGVESLEALTRYVKFVSKRQETATRALLRDPLR